MMSSVLKSYHDNTSTIDDIAELESNVKTMLANGRLDGEDLAVLPALDRSLMDGGTAVMDFDTNSSMFHAGAQDATGDTAATSAKGTNILIVVDAGGNVIDHTRLGLQPTVTLDLDRGPAYRPDGSNRLRLVLRQPERPPGQRNTGSSPRPR